MHRNRAFLTTQARLRMKLREQQELQTKEARTHEEGVLKFQQLVTDATQSVCHGQHLRFIGAGYRTTGVCLAALRHETGHNNRPYDIGSVPVAVIDEVVRVIKAETPDNSYLHKYLDEAVADKKAAAAEPGYFDEPWRCPQDVLDHYGASSWDDMLEKSFLVKWMSQ